MNSDGDAKGHPAAGSDGGGDADAELDDEVLAQCLERLELGDEDGLARLLAAHPERAARLGRRMAALRSLGLAASLDALGAPRRLGDFELLECLGSGGMGVVHRARQVSLGREVALKLVRPELLLFPGRRERFLREVATAGRLSHPGIVAAHQAGEERGMPWLAMELVRGATLAELLEALDGRGLALRSGDEVRAIVERVAAARGWEPNEHGARAPGFAGAGWEVAAAIGREVAEALEHAHRGGVLHRDVKPSNVMLTPEGGVRLLDFGLASARGADALTRTGSQTGSLPYMAPEQVRGGDVDERADVWGLGATLYELLAGRRAFDAEDPVRLAEQIAHGRPRRLDRPANRVPRDLAVVVHTALAPERARRYASAAQFADDLVRVLERRPIAARPVGAWGQAASWARRNPLPAATLATLALVVLGASWLVAWRERGAARIERELADALRVERDLARAEGERAQANLTLALDAVDAMLARVGERTLAEVPHLDGVRRALLEDALVFYRELLDQPAAPRSEVDELALRVKLAELDLELGRDAEALAAFEDLERRLLASAPDDARLGLRARAARARAAVHLTQGRGDQALAALEVARACFEARARVDQSERLEAAHGMLELARLRHLTGAPPQRALEEVEAARDTLARLDAGHARRADALALGAGIAAMRARLLDGLGRGDETRAALEEASRTVREALSAAPTGRDERRMLLAAALHAAYLWDVRGELERSAELLLAVRPIAEDLARDFPEVPQTFSDLLKLRVNLGGVLSSLGRLDEAEAILVELLAELEPRLEGDAEAAVFTLAASTTHYNLAELFDRRGDLERALEHADRSIGIARELLDAPGPGLPGEVSGPAAILVTDGLLERADRRLRAGDARGAASDLREVEPRVGSQADARLALAHLWARAAAELDADPDAELLLVDEAWTRALAALAAAVEGGWRSDRPLADAPAWDGLRGDERLEELVHRAGAGL